MINLDRVDALLRHIQNVQGAAVLLGKRLINTDKEELGKLLIANSMLHDNSKFFGLEWEILVANGEQDKEKLKLAVEHHRSVNKHHPEYWGGIDSMPDVYIAELVCDLHARSAEMGTDLRVYIKESFIPKHHISITGKVYKKIKLFVDLLLEPTFETL